MVQGHLKEKLIALVQAGTHEILSDVAVASGGTDTAPDPHALLEAAISACTIITCQMYANLKKWPLTSTNVDVQITTENGKQTVFNREISFAGDLTDEQTKRLFEIANKCPIHKILTSEIKIESFLKT